MNRLSAKKMSVSSVVLAFLVFNWFSPSLDISAWQPYRHRVKYLYVYAQEVYKTFFWMKELVKNISLISLQKPDSVCFWSYILDQVLFKNAQLS